MVVWLMIELGPKINDSLLSCGSESQTWQWLNEAILLLKA